MADDRTVAIGFLRQRDLDALGGTFTLAMPVQYGDVFEDLVAKT